MNFDNWYISSGYNYAALDTVIEIVKTLIGENHKVLFGHKFYYLSELNKEMLERYIDRKFALYIKNILYVGQIIDTDEFDRRMRSIFLKKYGKNKADADFINEGAFSINKLLEKFTDIDEKTLYDLKYTLTKSTHHTSDMVRTMFTEDKIRFKGMSDQSLAHICKFDWQGFPGDTHVEPMYTWLEINPEETIENALPPSDFRMLIYGYYRDLNLIVTDDLHDISNFIYYINTFWSSASEISISVNDNQGRFDEIAKSKLHEICGEDRKFEKFTYELLNDIMNRLNSDFSELDKMQKKS